MNPQEHSQPIHKVEIIISNLLRIGVIASLAIVVAGTVLSFSHHPDYSSSGAELAKITGPGASFPRTPGQIWRGMIELRGAAVVMSGLVLLIATPVMRVAVSIAAFAMQGDRIFVVITFAVLVLLLGSFLLGRAGG